MKWLRWLLIAAVVVVAVIIIWPRIDPGAHGPKGILAAVPVQGVYELGAGGSIDPDRTINRPVRGNQPTLPFKVGR